MKSYIFAGSKAIRYQLKGNYVMFGERTVLANAINFFLRHFLWWLRTTEHNIPPNCARIQRLRRMHVRMVVEIGGDTGSPALVRQVQGSYGILERSAPIYLVHQAVHGKKIEHSRGE